MFRKLAITAVFLVFTSPRLFALGLGEIDMQSVLNQPMRAVIELTSAAGADLSDIKVSIASLEAHQRAGLTKAPLLAGFRFSVEKGKTGNAVIRVSGTESVREPYIEFLLELQWPKGRMLRQYTVLVDPPVTMPAVAPVPTPAQSRSATTAPARIQAITPPAARTIPATAPATTNSASQFGPVRRADTLWSIAERVRPDNSVSIYQVMQALLRANPDAFIDNNINRMKAGVTLEVPALDEMRSMSGREAIAESNRQYKEWQAASSPENKATVLPEQAGAEQQNSATTETAQEEAPAASETPAETLAETLAETPAETPAEAHLTLVAPESDSVDGAAVPGDETQAGTETTDSDSLGQQLALATEEAEASRAQSVELQSRVNELEQQIDTMRRLLELKNHALAQLQDNSTQQDREAAELQAQQQSGEPQVTPAPLSKEGFQGSIVDKVMENPLLAGGFVLAAMLMGGFLWAANRKKRHADLFDEDMTLERHLERHGDSSRKQAPTINVHESNQQNDQLHATSHDGDPLTEADVYVAYGRVQQAEDLLRAALQDDPENDALQMKLLEVYQAAGNVTAFEEAASDYRNGVEEDDERWLKVASMGLSLSPHNDLFRAARTGMDSGTSQDRHAADLPGSIEFSLDDFADDADIDQDGVLAADDEVTTKLDLALAYIDMDDRESARNILDEVIEEGNSDQKQEAERIIARLA